MIREELEDNPPNTCEWKGCDKHVRRWVRFKKPTDYVYYCNDHALEASSLKNYEASGSA